MPEIKDVKNVRFSKRQVDIRRVAMEAEPSVELPDIRTWRVIDATFNPETCVLEGDRRDESLLMESPAFLLPTDTVCFFTLFLQTEDACGFRFSLRSVFEPVSGRSVYGSGELALSLHFHSRRSGRYHLALSGYQPEIATLPKARIDKIIIRTAKTTPFNQTSKINSTHLPGWSVWQRAVHALCRQSRTFNAAVAAWEMHLGKEEVLSLPQYMAICPTGQCNASCGFCSVTTNRTGIIKKQLPFESIDRFLSPVFGSLRLFGLEGNGEPTLYDRFDELLFRVTSRGSAVYLITNGERLLPEQIALLLASPTDAINFSLNAATAETHRRVMKLKGWDSVVQNISRFVRWRGDAVSPLLSVSIVVTRDNAHEVQQFLHFAEWQLQVDRILIRPLSEIANDLGAVEDIRELVPYASQIDDLLDAVAEYLEFVPRRAEIVIDPTAFNAFRPNPRGAVIAPAGFEQQLLAPRRNDWVVESPHTHITWQLNRLTFKVQGSQGKTFMKSAPIPVLPMKVMKFSCQIILNIGDLEIYIVDKIGDILGKLHADTTVRNRLSVEFNTERTNTVQIVALTRGESLNGQIDFGQCYSLSYPLAETILLPHSSRWQIDRPECEITWTNECLDLRANTQPGLYLCRSYTVTTQPQKHLSIPLKVSLKAGALGIGILSEDSKEWLANVRCESVPLPHEIKFVTGQHAGFQVVLYALTSAPLHASIDWSGLLDEPAMHTKRVIDSKRLLLPSSSHWIQDMTDTSIHWSKDKLSVKTAGTVRGQLLHSPRFPCPPRATTMPIVRLDINIRCGRLGIEFLGGESGRVLSRTSYAEGQHLLSIDIDTSGQLSLIAVVFSDSTEPLDAEIDWNKLLQLQPDDADHQWRGGLFDPRDPTEHATVQNQKLDQHALLVQKHLLGSKKIPKALSIPERTANIYRQAGIFGVLLKLTGVSLRYILPTTQRNIAASIFNWVLNKRFSKKQVYCQKPWTDLNNFTVDGRIDVCCITTGPSQERYALGNIFEQDFQQIWNGERMREFRRTVNTKNKLAPCERCPMANNYQPPF